MKAVSAKYAPPIAQIVTTAGVVTMISTSAGTAHSQAEVIGVSARYMRITAADQRIAGADDRLRRHPHDVDRERQASCPWMKLCSRVNSEMPWVMTSEM